MSAWLVGADAPPQALHARIGAVLVTVEQYDQAAKPQRKQAQRQQHADKENWRPARAQPQGDKSLDWDPWANATRRDRAADTWWKSSQVTPQSPSGTAWDRYTPTPQVAAKPTADSLALEARVERIEQAVNQKADQLASVENRVQKVEGSVSAMGLQMQANFDRLFATFEARNEAPDAPRKIARTDDQRGGLSWTASDLRGGTTMSEVDLVDMELNSAHFNVMFCNTASHRGHLDRMMEHPFDVISIGESNHVARDVKPVRVFQSPNGSEVRYNLAWTPPVRTDGDQRTPGRKSAGVVLAARQPLCAHPFESEECRALGRLGRLLMRRVEFCPGLWINLFAIYAPVTGWTHDVAQSTEFLTKALAEVVAAPEELNLVIGDFNVPFEQDLASNAAQVKGHLVDVGQALATETFKQPHTYRTSSSRSTIDRALCSPSLLRHLAAFTVLTNAATGSHLPIVVSFHKVNNKVPAVLKEVLTLPSFKDQHQLNPEVVLRWQWANANRFAEIDLALERRSVAQAYYLWAVLWESFLHLSLGPEHNHALYTGRATAKQQFRTPSEFRNTTQIQSEEEKLLWQLLGVLQGHRQNRLESSVKAIRAAERIHRSLCVKRSLPQLKWDSADSCADLEQAVHNAIRAERWRRITLRKAEWRSELNFANGANAAARRVTRGAQPRLRVLTVGTQAYTCPEMQGDKLCEAWDPIQQGTQDNIVLPDIWRNVKHARCTLPRLVASDLVTQLKKVRHNSACGPDWWRPHELRALPEAAMASLAAVLNSMEAEQVVPEALSSGWVCAIPKVGSVSGALNVRPITILSLIHRLWSGVRFTHLQDWMAKVLHDSQSAYRSGRSVKKEIHQILSHLDKRVRAGQQIYLGQLDLSKAFPRLNKAKARDIAMASGLPAKFACFLEEACLNKNLRWRISGVLSRPCANRRGTPQGCALSVMLFQLVMSPVARALDDFLKSRCDASRILLYADDMVVIASSAELLQQTMSYAMHLLESLDFTVNIAKSSVSVVGATLLPAIRLREQLVPFCRDPDVFGCTLTTRKVGMPTPNSLPEHSTSRSVGRWTKVKERTDRLAVLPVTFQAKLRLSLVLPVANYECWVLLPSKSTADAWSSYVARAVYSGIRGSKNWQLLAAWSPHQADVLFMCLHQLAREVAEDLLNEPLLPLFEVDAAERNRAFHTPFSAFVQLARLAGFSAEPEGLWNARVNVLISWPPLSVPSFLHDLRAVMRLLALLASGVDLRNEHNSVIDQVRSAPAAVLTRTQCNFLCTLQADAHRARSETLCPFCGEHGGVLHSVWLCEERSLATILAVPTGAEHWPHSFRRFGVVLEGQHISREEVVRGQLYMTSALIERRSKQRQLDEQDLRQRRQKRQRDEGLDGDDLAAGADESHPEMSNGANEQPECDAAERLGADALVQATRYMAYTPGMPGSSTDGMPAAALPTDTSSVGSAHLSGAAAGHASPTQPSITGAEHNAEGPIVIYSEDENEIPQRKAKRRRWALETLPQHIELQETNFRRQYFCHRCGCYTALQSRSAFFAKHWECTGASLYNSTNRHFQRKASLHRDVEEIPMGAQILDASWYQTRGRLPATVSQNVPGGLLLCRVCGISTPQCNRRRFLRTHLNCTEAVLVRGENGRLEVDWGLVPFGN
eukprot:4271580-Amphidinium_carterae.2